MNLRYILAAGILVAGISAQAAMTQRSAAVGELAAYCAPASRPASHDIVFMPDGTSYVERSDDGKRLLVKDISTGKELSVLFDVTHTRETELPDFEGFIVSPDASKVMVWRESEHVYRRSTTARYYVYEVRSRLLRPLSKEHDRQRDPLFSPDSRMVAFVADNNIYAAKLDYQTEVPVTTDGVRDRVINGATDWTYEEEFGVTSLMTWAPDNLTLCYVRFDESAVPMYSLPLYQGTCEPKDQYRLYPGSLSYKYPVAGEPNSAVSVHSYDVETRKTKQIDFPGGTPYYIPGLKYGPDPSRLMVATLNRDQNRFELFSVNPKSTVARSVYTDEAKAWIEPVTYEQLHYGPNSFTVASSGEGYTRFYEYSYAGAKLASIGIDGADATDYYGSDAAGNRYFRAAAPTPKDRTVYRLTRKGILEPLGKDNGTTDAVFSPGCAAVVLTYSNITTPPVSSLCRADGKQIRVIEDNKAYADRAVTRLADKEFFTMRADDGSELCGYVVKPKDFNSSTRYPVIMSQYSGPGSQQVLDRWSLDWEAYFASKGYVIICVDGRGTGGRGYAFRTAVYRRLGELETADQLAAARYAASLPYVDPSRIGIYGWSYGGYQSLMCATADNCPYAAAVAVAPVTDWRYYDTVYTERYMLTPQQNETGYNNSSVLRRALHLGCPTLVMYGTADDNVHPVNSLQFVSTLQSLGIMCDMFVFPNMNHSINGCNARQVVWARMLDYFNRNLK